MDGWDVQGCIVKLAHVEYACGSFLSSPYHLLILVNNADWKVWQCVYG